MRQVLTLLLLLYSVTLCAQKLTTLEYFYDTDPGFNKGIQVTLNSSAIDSSVNFASPNLPEGIHTLYVRLKNTTGNWSTVYQQNFLLTAGIAGKMVITTAEYYYDTDPGFGKGTEIALNNASLDSTLNFSAPNLPAGAHTLFIRVKNATGSWSTVYQGNFLLTIGAAGTSLITRAEYFYDTDPGIGKGSQLSLNAARLDSTLNFNDGGLSQGVHALFVRLLNNTGQWGTTYRSNVNIVPGSTGTPAIAKLEYFFDVDSGINRDKLITLAGDSLIDTTISIPVPDNGANYRTLGLRLSDQTGQTGNTTLDSISLCDFLKPIGGFNSAQYGSTFTLFDTSRYNPSGKIRWLVDNSLYDSGYMTNYHFTDGAASKTITEITGTGCRVDSVSTVLNMPGVESYQPQVGSYGSDFNLNIYGGGLDTGIVVYLQNGSSTIYPYEKFSSSSQQLIAVFDFHNFQKVIAGNENKYVNYALHIDYPDGSSYTGAAPIQIQSVQGVSPCDGIGLQPITCPPPSAAGDGEPYFARSLTGSFALRSGIWNTLTFALTNTGTVVAKQVMFHIVVPSFVDVDTTQWPIISPYPDLVDTFGLIIPIDTIIDGQHVQAKVISLIEPVLGPGETQTVPLRIRTTNTTPFNILYNVDKRMYGSPLSAFFPPCITAWLDGIGGFIPFYGCFIANYDLATNIGQGGVQAQNVYNGSATNPRPLFSAPLNYMGVLIGCIPAGKVAAAGGRKVLGKLMAEEFVANLSLNGENIGDNIGLNVLGSGFTTAGVGYSVLSNGNPCTQIQDEQWLAQPITTRLGWDPNSLSGTSMYDTTKHFIHDRAPQLYTASFENEPSATAAVQHVYLVDTLNPAKFVFSTFKLLQFTIADSIYYLPSFRQAMTIDVGLKTRQDMKLRFAASFDTLTGILRADYFSIDTSGHVLPADSLDGFLPPDVDGVSGTGSIGYAVYGRPLNTLDTFSNRAFIYFDANAPIPTNTWVNTIDTTSPTSKILSAIVIDDTTAKLTVASSDVGSGVLYNELFVKRAGDTTFQNIGVFYGDTVRFTGKHDSTYALYVKAVDNVTNQEERPDTAEISITLNKDSSVVQPGFNVRLVPNPVSNALYVQNNSGDVLMMMLYDAMGRKLETATILPGTTTINMSAFSNGMYVVQLIDKTNNKTTVTKIMKLHP